MSKPKKFTRWISRMLSEGDGTPSTKRVAFLLAITSAIILCLGLFVRHDSAPAVDLMKWIVTAAGTAYGITRFAEYGNSTPPQS
jgi:hypothetical protein